MKFGLLSAILPDYSFEQVIDYAAAKGFSCVELCAWPAGKAQRRYAGVTHLNVDTLTDEKAKEINDYISKKHIEISALGFYPNPLDPDSEKSAAAIAHIRKLIEAAKRLGVPNVNTFIGRDKSKTVEENLELFAKVWPPIVAYAEECGVNIAIENCPMYFTKDEWPGGNNLCAAPYIWRELFRIIPSKRFGLNYDPSHLHLQGMDYVKPLYEFADRMLHIHFKDIKVYPEKLDEYGIFAHPLLYMSPKIPGLGGIDWARFCSALYDIRYQGAAVIEVEDKAFEDSPESVLRAIDLAATHLRQFIC